MAEKQKIGQTHVAAETEGVLNLELPVASEKVMGTFQNETGRPLYCYQCKQINHQSEG